MDLHYFVPTHSHQLKKIRNQGRYNLTIMNSIRSMYKTIENSNIKVKLSKTFWPYVAKTANYVINKLPTKSNPENKSPYKMVVNKIPNLRN